MEGNPPIRAVSIMMQDNDDDDDDDENDDLRLGILTQSVCRTRREFENQDFQVTQTLPVLGERLLTVLENCLAQVDLLTALPSLSQQLLRYQQQEQQVHGQRRKRPRRRRREGEENEEEEDVEGEMKTNNITLPNILGIDSIQALYRLLTATASSTRRQTQQQSQTQMVWNASKYGYGDKIQTQNHSQSRSPPPTTTTATATVQDQDHVQVQALPSASSLSFLFPSASTSSHGHQQKGRVNIISNNNMAKAELKLKPLEPPQQYPTTIKGKKIKDKEEDDGRNEDEGDKTFNPGFSSKAVDHEYENDDNDEKTEKELLKLDSSPSASSWSQFYDSKSKTKPKSTLKWEADGKGKDKDKEKTKRKKEKGRSHIISMLEKSDDSQLKFLSSLLQGSEDDYNDDYDDDDQQENNRRTVVGGGFKLPSFNLNLRSSLPHPTNTRTKSGSDLVSENEQDNTDDKMIQAQQENKKKKKKRNILRKIRAALASKYEDHVKKALQDKDKRALLCMLALLPPEPEPQEHIQKKQDGKDKEHKITCSKYRPQERKNEQEYKEEVEEQEKEDGQIQPFKAGEDEEEEEEYEYEDEDEAESFGLRLIMIEDDSKIRRFDSQNSSRLSNCSSREDSRPIISSSSSSTCFLSPDNDVGDPRNGDGNEGDDSSLLDSDVWGLNENKEEEEEEEDDGEGGEYQENYGETADISFDLDLDPELTQQRDLSSAGQIQNQNQNEEQDQEPDHDEDEHQVVKIMMDEYAFMSPISKTISSSSSSTQSESQPFNFDQREPNLYNSGSSRLELTRTNFNLNLDKIPEEKNESIVEVGIEKETKNHQAQLQLSRSQSHEKADEEEQEQQVAKILELFMQEKAQEEKLAMRIRQVLHELSKDNKYFQYRVFVLQNLQHLGTEPQERNKDEDTHWSWTCTEELKTFRRYFHALVLLMRDRLATSLQDNIRREARLLKMWKSEKRALKQLKSLQLELKMLEDVHIPNMLTLDFQIRILKSRLQKISKENFGQIRHVIRDTEFNAAVEWKSELSVVEKLEFAVTKQEENKVALRSYISAEEIKLQHHRKELDLLLRKEIERYDERIFKMQYRLDAKIAEKLKNETKVAATQSYFADVQERFTNMKGAKKLKQIMRNREIADEFKRNRSAKIIQDYWRRYKARKRRKERRGKKKGKKKKK